MSEDLSKIRRYELKYTIDEIQAREIRDYVKNICTLDKHVPPGKNFYVVNNLYFDTPDLRFYTDTKHKKLTRFKPRARYYGMKAKDYIWPEIKYRHGNIIWKRRFSIPIEQWPTLFQAQLSNRLPEAKPQIDRFDEVIHWFGAEPILHVRYIREPYVTELETYGRVTFDRQLCFRKVNGSIELDYNEADMRYYDDPYITHNPHSPVILEIKIETLVPIWAIELIRIFNLTQRAFSKYCYGLDYLMDAAPNIRQAVNS